MNIVIIAYRPDATNVCRGCFMGSSESDMQYGVYDNLEEASDFLAYRLMDNSIRDKYLYAEYELTFIINGIDVDDGEYDPEIYENLSNTALHKKIIFEQLHLEQKAEQDAASVAAATERIHTKELKELARLQEKYKQET